MGSSNYTIRLYNFSSSSQVQWNILAFEAESWTSIWINIFNYFSIFFYRQKFTYHNLEIWVWVISEMNVNYCILLKIYFFIDCRCLQVWNTYCNHTELFFFSGKSLHQSSMKVKYNRCRLRELMPNELKHRSKKNFSCQQKYQLFFTCIYLILLSVV